MGVNGVTEVTNNIATTYTSTVNSPVEDKKKDKEVEVKKEAAAVYEKSEENSSTSKVSSKETDRTKIIQQLKADDALRQQQLLDIVHKMMGKQAKTYGIANSENDEDSIWKFLAKGDFTVDAATKAQAQEDISENGYWGVKQTSERILDFAKALAGDDPEKLEKMRSAFEKGYKQAEKTWGGELPDISKQTFDAVMKGFDELTGKVET
ncbi:hypothetical protein [Butyrivibrio sp. FCS006]|jgi:hypothetical protein|uniref:hypothetical protein n=1 Tax=Butyrivibrio sp. FCS006 TaxID=1280684 RepID=UPI0003FFCB1E|nr:hypothetical protein [Butyrivibrio sp. FCS006]MBO6196344.1 hypothetical protein [Butyrivibrio sp.]MBP3824788.1 hypothetical protein [Butyrivibrio sp.]MBP5297526.1 hypothetical protein [Lachnospiraceae bacterium]